MILATASEVLSMQGITTDDRGWDWSWLFLFELELPNLAW